MAHIYPDLDQTIKLYSNQKEIYKPSSFWLQASENIIEDIKTHGIDNFRRLKTPLSFFVPNYGIPANSFNDTVRDDIYTYLDEKGTKKQNLAMKEFLSGYFHALSDYRVFIAGDDKSKNPIIETFSESNFGNPLEHFGFEGKMYSRSSLNYLQGLCFLKEYLEDQDEIKTVLEIGGGFGSLGEILRSTHSIKYIDIDIPPISYIAWCYLNSVYDKNEIENYIHNKETINIDELKRCSVLNSWDIEKLQGSIDLFVNFISFQEMEPAIVANYLSNVKRLNPKWVLLRNMREGKNVKKSAKDIGVEVPIKKDDYTIMLSDHYDLKASNIHPYGYKTVDGFHSELLLYKKKDF